uniref:RRM domain-containing protein n=1 Tax=Lotharella globosa TaxID=91324 RepID=A0A7S4DX10_9EUKA
MADREQESRDKKEDRENGREDEKEKDRDDDRRERRRRRRSRSRDGDRDRDRDERGDRDRSRSRKRRRSRERRRRRRRSDSRRRSESPPIRRRTPSPDPMEIAKRRAEEEEIQRQRDENTVFVYQIHPKVDERDLFEFFSAVGKVTDIRLIRDQRTHKSKGLCYIEFAEHDSVMKAISLTGQQLGGFPITVTVTQAEKNRQAEQADGGSMRLYVGSLHFKVTEDDLRPVFETFGPLDFIDLHKDPATGISRGFGFVQYKKAADAKTALTNLNGLEIAGRAIKVGMVETKSEGGNVEDLDDSEGGGLALTAQSRANLMQRLNRDQIQMPGQPSAPQNTGVIAAKTLSVPKIQMTECVVISNMFDPATEEDPEFHLDIKEDVEEEVNKYGTIKHIFVDKTNPKGMVYVRVDSPATGEKIVKSLHGRWFASRQIRAECVVPATYEIKFPESKK